METMGGMGGGAPPMEAKPEAKSSTTVLGWLAFGAAFIMAGLASLPTPYGNSFGTGYQFGTYLLIGGGSVYSLAVLFSGLGLLLAGFISLWKGHQFQGSAFAVYGLFWISFATALTAAPMAYSLSAFAFIFVLISLTFLISSMKHGWGTFFLFLLTTVAFILWLAEFWLVAPSGTKAGSLSSGMSWAVGGEFVLTGIVAWWGATAELANSTYGRKVLPM